MNERENFGIEIGAKEIYDAVMGLRTDVQSLVQSREAAAKTLEDHESRLRGLERWKYGIPLAGLSGLVATVMAVLQIK